MKTQLLASTTFNPVRAYDNGNTLQSSVNGAMGLKNDELEKRDLDATEMHCFYEKVDVLIGGIDRLRNEGCKYLPKFPGEEREDYEFRLQNSVITNIYQDILDSLASKPFEKEVKVVETDKPIPEEILSFIEDVDGAGMNLHGFAADAFYNAINYTIDWIFVDSPKVDSEQIKTRADEKSIGFRPFWSHVLASNILEVKSKVLNGKEVLTRMRIVENGDKRCIRVFDRQEATGIVTWGLYQENDRKEYDLIDSGIIEIGVIPLVPIITGRRKGRRWQFRPALQSAVDMQLQLYRNESALEYIKNLAGYPMLAANGISPPMEADGKTPIKVRIGPNRMLWSPANGSGSIGEYKYVEPTANTMEFLSNDITKAQKELRELGKQPLTAQSGNLTVITTAVAAGKARSAVSAWAKGLGNSLENALVLTLMYYGIKLTDYSPEVEVYDDFDRVEGNSDDLTALRAARDAGDLSLQTYWGEMQRRGVLSDEFNADEERKRLLEEVPGDIGNMGTDNPPPDNT